MYIIEDMIRGTFIAEVQTYEQALLIQHNEFQKGIDTYIRKI